MAPLLAPATCCGRPRIYELRRVLNAVLYILREPTLAHTAAQIPAMPERSRFALADNDSLFVRPAIELNGTEITSIE